MIRTTLVASAICLLAAGAASATTPANRDPGVNKRQHNQQHRINQGVRSGELTKEEAKGLRVEQKSIRQEERTYKSDGKLTKDERKDLHQDMNQASRNIHQEKHDAEKRTPPAAATK